MPYVKGGSCRSHCTGDCSRARCIALLLAASVLASAYPVDCQASPAYEDNEPTGHNAKPFLFSAPSPVLLSGCFAVAVAAQTNVFLACGHVCALARWWFGAERLPAHRRLGQIEPRSLAETGDWPSQSSHETQAQLTVFSHRASREYGQLVPQHQSYRIDTKVKTARSLFCYSKCYKVVSRNRG